MKRLHVHVGVADLEAGIRFYTTLFGSAPVKTRSDYARWMLDDPRVNFAISTRASQGVDHLGVQVDGDEELAELRERLEKVDLTLFDEGQAVCCYARSEKSWVEDPAGIAWEAYRTMEDAQVYSDNDGTCCSPSGITAGCCAP